MFLSLQNCALHLLDSCVRKRAAELNIPPDEGNWTSIWRNANHSIRSTYNKLLELRFFHHSELKKDLDCTTLDRIKVVFKKVLQNELLYRIPNLTQYMRKANTHQRSELKINQQLFLNCDMNRRHCWLCNKHLKISIDEGGRGIMLYLGSGDYKALCSGLGHLDMLKI